MIRAAAVRVRWVQFSLDAMILVVGFGAFFWFLVIRPAASSTEIDVIKNALSQTYIALNCILLLTLGVVLLTRGGNPSGRAGARIGQIDVDRVLSHGVHRMVEVDGCARHAEPGSVGSLGATFDVLGECRIGTHDQPARYFP